MDISKHRLKGLSSILLLILLITALLPVSAFAAELPTTTATITVEKKLTGDTPPSAETFTFTLTPDNGKNPMPEGTNANTLTINGAGNGAFGAITYSEPGNYIYTVKEIAGNTANYTYDTTVYKVTVYVTTDDTRTLAAKVWVNKDGADGKAASAVFTNSYKLPADSNSPKTGDTSNMALWIVLAVVSFAAWLVIMSLTGRRYKRRGDDTNETDKG